MPNIQVKLRRGTTAQHAGFTGAEGEVTVDTDLDTLRVHDGSTAGGERLAKYSELAGAGAGTVTSVDSGTGLTGGPITTSGTLSIAAGGVDTTQLADNGVTFAKMQDINTAKVIGRTTAGSGDPEEVSILDEDAMTSNSATALATQQSIKAYVDSQVGASVYTSSETSVPAVNTTVTWTHGLGQAPDLIELILRCKTAEYGYSVGDEVRYTSEYTGASLYNFWANSTTIGFRGYLAAGASLFNLVRRDITGSTTQATPANWKVVVKGIVF
jgi:hypothetical protein